MDSSSYEPENYNLNKKGPRKYHKVTYKVIPYLFRKEPFCSERSSKMATASSKHQKKQELTLPQLKKSSERKGLNEIAKIRNVNINRIMLRGTKKQ